MIQLDILKDGKRHAVTMSYDDGDRRDERLISIFNQYLVSGRTLGQQTQQLWRSKDLQDRLANLGFILKRTPMHIVKNVLYKYIYLLFS